MTLISWRHPPVYGAPVRIADPGAIDIEYLYRSEMWPYFTSQNMVEEHGETAPLLRLWGNSRAYHGGVESAPADDPLDRATVRDRSVC